MKRLHWLTWVYVLACFGYIVYLMVSGGSPASVTVRQATILLPLVALVIVGLGVPLWQGWVERRAVREHERSRGRA